MKSWLFIVVILFIIVGAMKGLAQGFAPNSTFSNGSPSPLQASGINWYSLHALDTSYGGYSGINWQSFGA